MLLKWVVRRCGPESVTDLLYRFPTRFVFQQNKSVSTNNPTETVVLRALSDILQAVDRGNTAALVLLDLKGCISHGRPRHSGTASAILT